MSAEEDFAWENATPVAPTPEPKPEPAPRQLPAKVARPAQPLLIEAPFSLEAEESLLSCCFIDGEDSVKRCIEAGITERTFYAPANQIIYATLLDLYLRKQSTDTAVVAEELKATGMLDRIGGFAYLAQVSSRIPTTAQVPYFVDRVAQLYRERESIRLSQQITTSVSEGASIDDLQETFKRLTETLQPHTDRPIARPLMELTATDDERRAANLLGNGFLRRRQGALLPGATGIGKSSLSMQALVLWALGKPFFGIKPQGPLTSLLVQAENDDIDLVEMRDGVCDGLALTATEREIVARRVFILTAHERGAELMQRLESEVKRIKPDLLVLDPLFAFMEGAVKEQEAASYFLRAVLQPFLVRYNLAAIILHHTNKPPSGKEKSTWQGNDFSYAGSGSIEFANWARAVILLRSIGKADVFELMLPKRGKRAGITDASGTLITSVMIRHARTPGKIFWELADASDTRQDESNARSPQVVKAFFSLDRGDGVSLETLARRLRCSARTVRRDLKDGRVKTDEGETLVIRDSKVFAEDTI